MSDFMGDDLGKDKDPLTIGVLTFDSLGKPFYKFKTFKGHVMKEYSDDLLDSMK